MLQLLQLEILISTWPEKVVSVYKDFNALVNSVQSATWEKKEAGAQEHPYKARNKDSVGGGGEISTTCSNVLHLCLDQQALERQRNAN